MSLLLIELPLALIAYRRGWRATPALLLAFPFVVLAFESGVAALLAPVVSGYFDPAGTARAVSHGIALVGLLITAAMEPSEPPTAARALAPAKARRTGSLYQI
jgi:citrate lyase beta subunit